MLNINTFNDPLFEITFPEINEDGYAKNLNITSASDIKFERDSRKQITVAYGDTEEYKQYEVERG